MNGSPTVDFKVKRGLRQGDLLSSFLFLIVVEEFVGMVQKAVQLGSFEGYKVTSEHQYSLLQFTEDTILVGKGSWYNL